VRHGITRKKTVVAAEQTGAAIARARTAWREGRTALDPEKRVFPETRVFPEKLVLIDESGFDTKMTRRFGRAARGAPCLGAVPHGHWRNTTFVAGLRSDRIDALMLIAGAMDAAAFCAWVEQLLAPTLSPGDLVICDNLSVHKTAKARAATQARGAELRFRRAHAPDLNPLDMVFAKLKARVRSAAARCADTLCSAIASALNAFNPQECARYLRHAGYASTWSGNTLSSKIHCFKVVDRIHGVWFTKDWEKPKPELFTK